MRSPLGVGASRFHTGGEAGEVDTVYLGAFRREALLAIGGFDERFTRAQDWELNFRLRENGGIVYFDPRLHVTYRPRSTVRALAKQYFEYGRWRRVVSRRHSGTINYRYLAPPCALVGFSLSRRRNFSSDFLRPSCDLSNICLISFDQNCNIDSRVFSSLSGNTHYALRMGGWIYLFT